MRCPVTVNSGIGLVEAAARRIEPVDDRLQTVIILQVVLPLRGERHQDARIGKDAAVARQREHMRLIARIDAVLIDIAQWVVQGVEVRQDRCGIDNARRCLGGGHCDLLLGVHGSTVGVGDGEGDGIGAARGIGVRRVLVRGGLAVAEVPEVGGDLTRRLVGELDGEAVGRGGELSRQWGSDNDLLLGIGALAVGVADGEGDGVGAARDIGMRRVLVGGGLAVAEVPEVGGDLTRGLVGELHGEAVGRGGELSRQWGSDNDLLLGIGALAVGVGDGEGDGIGAACGVGMRRVLVGGGLAVAEVPEVGGDLTRRLVGELDSQAVGCGGELSRQWGGDSDLLLGIGALAVGVGEGEGDGIGAARGVGVRRVLVGGGLAVAEVPEVGGDLTRRLVGELDSQAVGRGGELSGQWSSDSDLLLGIGALAVGVGDGEGDGVGAARGVGMRRVLVRGGLAVAEVPEVGGDLTRRLVGELDGEAVGRGGELSRQWRGDNDLLLSIGALAVGVGDGEGDGIGAARGVGMRRVLVGGGLAVAEVPEVGGDLTRGLVCELDVEAVGRSGELSGQWGSDNDLLLGVTDRPLASLMVRVTV